MSPPKRMDRKKPLHVRLTEAEKALIDRAAEGETISAWSRRILIEAAKKKLRSEKKQ